MSKINRRAVLAGAAAMPALTVPAAFAAVEPDPVYASIERHRTAIAAWLPTVDLLDVEPGKETDPADEAAYKRTYSEINAAALALIDIKPVTMAGVLALLQYAAQCADRIDPYFPDGLISDDADPETAGLGASRDWTFFVLSNAAEALATLTARQCVS